MRVKFVDGFFYKEQTLKLLQDLFGKVEESDNPDFLFCSVGYSAERFNYNCARIFLTGENIVPDFNCVDYAIGFNYFSFGDRYKRIPLYCFYTDDYAIALNRILKNYGDIVAEIVSPVEIDNLNIIDVKNFDQLLDIEEEIRMPILFYETIPDEQGEFIIICDNMAYRYVIG